MCHIIDSEIVLLHVLNNNESCNFTKLQEVKSRLEEQFPNLYIDVTRKSILSSILNFPQLFCWNNKVITRAKDSEQYFSESMSLFSYTLQGVSNGESELIDSIEALTE